MNITIRRGAPHWDMTVEENGGASHFDFADMTRGQRAKVRRMTVGALKAKGLLARPKAKRMKKHERRRANHV